MKAVIATDQYIPPTASRQAPPVHEATGGHAVRGNYCIHNHLR